MQFVLMYGVMLILYISCLFVLLRLARGFEDQKNYPGTWILKCQASCALDHFYTQYCSLMSFIHAYV
jgi:hypothetical protein